MGKTSLGKDLFDPTIALEGTKCGKDKVYNFNIFVYYFSPFLQRLSIFLRQLNIQTCGRAKTIVNSC